MPKKFFPRALGGYSSKDVDSYIAWLENRFQDLEKRYSTTLSDQEKLKAQLAELETALQQARQLLTLQSLAGTIEPAADFQVEKNHSSDPNLTEFSDDSQPEAKNPEVPIPDLADSSNSSHSFAQQEPPEIVISQSILNEIYFERRQTKREASEIQLDTHIAAAKIKAELRTEVNKVKYETQRILSGQKKDPDS